MKTTALSLFIELLSHSHDKWISSDGDRAFPGRPFWMGLALP